MDSVTEVVENTRNLSLARERDTVRDGSRERPQQMPGSPLPSRCSSKLKLIIERQLSLGQDPTPRTPVSGPASLNASPYVSPYGSPCSSPRIKRKPLKETKRVMSREQLAGGDYVQLNQYKVEEGRVLGQGSYGMVKLAYNREDDKNYAMKILSKKKLQRKAGMFFKRPPPRKEGAKKPEDPLDKVYREIAILKKIDHPNVVKLVEVVDDPGEDNLYMVFELLDRGEVLEIPSDKPLTEEEAIKCFRDVVHGLEYLHYQKVIHRDIKPSNLLRADNGEVKIADLGVSDEFDGVDAVLTATAGTPAFTPPECLVTSSSSTEQQARACFSGRSADIWSLGVTLFCLVTGRLPFPGSTVVEVYDRISSHHPDLDTENMSAELQDLIARMLVKDPLSRISLAQIKEHVWVTGYGVYPMMEEEENCTLIEVTEDEVENSVQHINNLDSLILVKPHKKMSF